MARTAFFRVITQHVVVIPSNIPGQPICPIFKERGFIACAGITLNFAGTYYKSNTLIKISKSSIRGPITQTGGFVDFFPKNIDT
jgi:hypothetical protein